MSATSLDPDAAAGPLRDPDTPSSQAAAGAMQALARAARSFVLYDPSNALVRQFLGEYRERTAAAVKACGELAVEVRPFELALGEFALYRETDRERSLAFKLYRDGVRRITFRPSVTWEELLTLLVILAVRYTTVRQQEEDAVTLLKKAEFQGIAVVAIAGFVPSEANPEPEVEELARDRAHRAVPADWDTPMPRLPQPVALQPREVPAAALAALRGDASLEATGPTAFALARDLLAEATRAGWTGTKGDLAPFLAEIRDFFLAEGQLESLRQLLELVASIEHGPLRDELLASLGDARTLDLVLDRLPPDLERLPANLLAILPALDVPLILERLASAPPGPRRAVLLQLVEAVLPRGAAAVVAQLPSLDPERVEPLVRALAARAPDQVGQAGTRLLEQGSEPLQLLGLGALEAGSGSIPIDLVVKLLRAPSEALRVRAAELLCRKGDETAVPALRQALEAPSGRSLLEAEALGRALAELAPLPAVRLFAAWLEYKGQLLRGLSAERKVQQWAAVAGLAVMPNALPDASLAALAERSDQDLRRHCLAALALRRKGRAHAHG
jgi:hypothetical protein